MKPEKFLNILGMLFLILVAVASHYGEKRNQEFFSQLPRAEQEQLENGFKSLNLLDKGDLVSYDGKWYELEENPRLSGFLELHGIYNKELSHNHYIEHSWSGMKRLLDDHKFECVTMTQHGYSALSTIHPNYGW